MVEHPARNDPSQISRVSRRGFCGLLLPLLAGACAPSGPPSPSHAEQLVDLQSRYANEAHSFPFVNRAAFAPDLLPMTINSPFDFAAGTLIVDTQNTHLYFQLGNGQARRYGIGVGDLANDWHGTCTIRRKAKWPNWHPTPSMRAADPSLPVMMAGGSDNPLGARALYLYQNGRDTLFRIHGTPRPWTIGQRVSAGCIRMVNEDVIALFEHVELGAKVHKL